MENKRIVNDIEREKIRRLIKNNDTFLQGYLGFDNIIVIFFFLGILVILLSGMYNQYSDIVVSVYLIGLISVIVGFFVYRKKRNNKRFQMLDNNQVYVQEVKLVKKKSNQSNPTAIRGEINYSKYYFIFEMNNKKIKKRVYEEVYWNAEVGDSVYLVCFSPKDSNLVVKF